jgi:hypothetical protein
MGSVWSGRAAWLVALVIGTSRSRLFERKLRARDRAEAKLRARFVPEG